MRLLLIAIASSAVVTCGGSSPPQAPVVESKPGSEMIKGTERIGWDQPAADAAGLAKTRYAIYVDGARSELAGATCTPSAGAARFSCTARLPSLTPGAHALQIAAFVVDGSTTKESPRSAPLNVTVESPSTVGQPSGTQTVGAAATRVRDAARTRVETLFSGLDMPTDLAVAPDGRLFAAERRGRILIVGDRGASVEPPPSMARWLAGGQLLALALDPQFARTHYVYVLFTSPSRNGGWMFSIARLREASGTLGDVIVVLDGVRASASPAGALRFGPDGKLYAAFDTGDDARRAGDRGSYNGKVLRLNGDGTTPADQPGATPVFASDFVAPSGLAWHAASKTLWVADRRAGGPAQLRAITGSASSTYALPADAMPTGIAVSGARDVWVASEGGAGLLRVRVDSQTGRPVETERLLQDGAAAVHAVAVSPDGAMVIATSSGIDRILLTGAGR